MSEIDLEKRFSRGICEFVLFVLMRGFAERIPFSDSF